MIFPTQPDDAAPEPSDERGDVLAAGASVERTVLLVLTCSGPDPTVDRVARLRAMRLDGGPAFERECGDADDATAEAQAAFAELIAYVGKDPLLVATAETFDAWQRHLSSGAELDAMGLDELASLLLPGRLLRDADPVRALCPDATEDYGPDELHLATAELLDRITSLPEGVLEAGALALLEAWVRFAAPDPRAAARVARALCLVERADLFDLPARRAGRVQAALSGEDTLATLVAGTQPRYARLALERCQETEPLPNEPEGQAPFHPEDEAALARIFGEVLPRQFDAPERPGQRAVAEHVARTLGSQDLLLVHAPTGTGKTLAYLVPTLLWARRHGVRVGVATYTRTLQEQAMLLEVPRALNALAEVTPPAAAPPNPAQTGGEASEWIEPEGANVSHPLPVVTALKGRENYVCWRSLKLHLPSEADEPEAWLAWTTLLLFAADDEAADLDRFPRRPPIALASESRWRSHGLGVVAGGRARSGCCRLTRDRETCGAECARRRAERSHVVLTNHSFVLFRQEFFKVMVFDECEHLHDQAHNAWSHGLSVRGLDDVLQRVRRADPRRRRGILDLCIPALQQAVLPLPPPEASAFGGSGESAGAESGAAFAVRLADRQEDARLALSGLDSTLDDFERWRDAERRSREEAEEHSLLREYCASEAGVDVVLARRRLVVAIDRLDGELAELAERLDVLAVRSRGRLRRSLELVRTDLAEAIAAIEAWLPLNEGQPRFRPETFHDVEQSPRGERLLSARVLLPDEYLARHYYHQLHCGVLLSATTWLQGGFDASLGYLGLDRVGRNDDSPRRVRTFRAPEVFDYGRVLIAAPRGLSYPTTDKHRYLSEVRTFIAELCERTRGRMLVLFTNSEDARRMGEELSGFFRARSIPLYVQGMPGATKEQLGALFRRRVDSVLFGVDTFWYGADFPGDTLQYLVIVRLPYGVPDRYHHAQCAAVGRGEQRRRIYLPRALAKFRQGFGRLMRKETDRGVVFLLDGRVHDPRHRHFMRELPLVPEPGFCDGAARVVRGDLEHVVHEALLHTGVEEPLPTFELEPQAAPPEPQRPVEPKPEPEFIELPDDDLPF